MIHSFLLGDRVNRSLALIASILISAPAFAQWPNTPKTETAAPAQQTPPPPPPRHAPARDTGPRGDDGSGFGVGIRAAWAMPSGGLTNSESVGDSIDYQIPIWLEAGYHFNKNFYAGLYFQWAPLFAGNNCLAGADCSSSGLRFGAEILYHIIGEGLVQPWVGLGGGYEILNVTRAAGADRTFKGLELLNVQAGIDLGLSSHFTVGPYASYQLFGKYSSFSSNGVSNDITDSTGHSWLQVGLKTAYRF